MAIKVFIPMGKTRQENIVLCVLSFWIPLPMNTACRKVVLPEQVKIKVSHLKKAAGPLHACLASTAVEAMIQPYSFSCIYWVLWLRRLATLVSHLKTCSPTSRQRKIDIETRPRQFAGNFLPCEIFRPTVLGEAYILVTLTFSLTYSLYPL